METRKYSYYAHCHNLDHKLMQDPHSKKMLAPSLLLIKYFADHIKYYIAIDALRGRAILIEYCPFCGDKLSKSDESLLKLLDDNNSEKILQKICDRLEEEFHSAG